MKQLAPISRGGTFGKENPLADLVKSETARLMPILRAAAEK
jgi:hypothetical protein